jgi:hypothetical protein
MFLLYRARSFMIQVGVVASGFTVPMLLKIDAFFGSISERVDQAPATGTRTKRAFNRIGLIARETLPRDSRRADLLALIAGVNPGTR